MRKSNIIWNHFIKALPVTLLAILVTAAGVLAATGTLDSPAEPGSTSSFSLEAVYQRLTTGAAGSQSGFTEPSVAPGTGTIHTINDLLGAGPEQDDDDGAAASDVLPGATFWGLTGDEWGPQTGNMPEGSDVTGADGSLAVDLPDGYYSGKQATASDSDLLSENIMSGVNIFGVQGSTYNTTCTCEGTLVRERWCNNGDGTITDMLGYAGAGKCLVWLKDADCLGERTWQNSDVDDAFTKVAELKNGVCGLSDGSETGDW